jgi:hypothetical protein
VTSAPDVCSDGKQAILPAKYSITGSARNPADQPGERADPAIMLRLIEWSTADRLHDRVSQH